MFYLLTKGLKLWNDIPTENGTVTANVAENSKERVLQELKDSNINYSIMEKNLQRLIDSEKFKIKKTRAFGGGFNFETYNMLSDIESYLDSVEQKYRSKAKSFSIGQSYEGREIKILIIRANIEDQKPIVMLECGIHAREWVSPASCLWMANELLTKENSLLEKYEFHIVPVTNPDGYEYTWNYDRLWRKNRKPNPDAPLCPGTDLNRNFDIDFCRIGCSRNPCDEVYCGTSGFSESETQAIRDYVLRIKDSLKIYIS
ncbi:carboxypeptidase B-like protein, partial [Leptotrombidium deliense]